MAPAAALQDYPLLNYKREPSAKNDGLINSAIPWFCTGDRKDRPYKSDIFGPSRRSLDGIMAQFM
jgi:hypothetical protein